MIDELDSLGIAFISRREGINTDDHNPMGRLFLTIIGSIAGYLLPDVASQQRVGTIISRLGEIASL